MATRNLLYKREFPLEGEVVMYIPTVGEILEDEDAYYDALSVFTAMPIDMMVQLDDLGIDFSTIDEWDLFLILFGTIKDADTSLIFKNLNWDNFQIAMNPKTSEMVLLDKQSGFVFDRYVHCRVADFLRKLHHLDKDIRKPANKEARDYLIQRQRKKLKRQRNRTVDSPLEELIVAMVNTEQFHYDFDGVKKLTIYQFNESVRQIVSKVEYDNRMFGVYSGTINVTDLSQDDLNWLIHK